MNWIKRITSHRGTVIAGVIIVSMLIALQVMLFFKLQMKVQDSHQWTARTSAIIDKVNTLVNKIEDAELSKRAYLLTGEKRLLRPFYLEAGEYQNALEVDPTPIPDFRNVHYILEELSNLTKDNGDQARHLLTLRSLIDEGIAISEQNIAARLKSVPSSDSTVEEIKSGIKIMRSMKSVTDTILSSERQLLDLRTRTDTQTQANLSSFIYGAGSISYAALFGLILIIGSNLRRSKRLMDELSEKESYFRAAAEGALSSFFIFQASSDDNGDGANPGLQYVNSLGERMMGAKLSALQRQPLSDVMAAIHGNDQELDSLYYLAAVLGQQVQEREYIVKSGPFIGRYMQEHIVPLPAGIAVSCRDITERKQIDSMKNEFISTVSHELRTPLTAIRGALGLIVGGVAGDISIEAKAILNIAYSNCERLVRLINDILDIEKIEAGRMNFDRRLIAIRAFLRQAIEMNSALAERFGVSLVLEPETVEGVQEETKVYADFDKLMQVVTNLLSNAIKFSQQDSEVIMSCTLQDKFVEIEVRDKGIGIPAKFHSQIFQKFAQADGSDSRQKNGTGLGLSIVKIIVEAMGGNIHFESEEGVGTSFFFTVPLPEEMPVAIKLDAPVKVNPEAKRVLICEDEPDIANLLKLILEREGIDCDLASDAATATSLLRQRRYLSLLIDLNLPDKSGASVIRDIKQKQDMVDLPIIVVSAKVDGARQVLKDEGISIVDWLEKPVDADRLVAQVKGLQKGNALSRILHVEDDRDLSDVLKFSLSGIAETTWVPTLQEARSYLAKRRFDLVVLDIALPDGSGLDLLPLIGAGGRYPTPIVLFTAREVPADVSPGVAASLIKSKATEESLVQTVRRVICGETIDYQSHKERA